MSLDFARLRLDSASQRVNRFIDDNLVQWATEEIIDRLKADARALELSARVQDAISYEKTDFLKGEVIFDLTVDGQPIDEFLENGFRPHVIEAKGKGAGGADFLRWVDKNGKTFFRRKVNHPGFEGYHFIEKGVRQTEQNLERRIIQETERFMEKERLK